MDRPSTLLSDVRQLIAHLPVAVYICEAPTGVIVAHNRRAVELWGREPRPGDPDERFCGSFRLYHPEGTRLAHHETPMAEVLRDGIVREAEVVIERPDGSRLTARVDVAPLRGPAGELLGAVNVFQDVTATKAGEEALRRSEARYRAIVESQPDLVCRFLADGTLTFVNDAYCRYFGFAREEMIGKPYAPIVHPDDVEEVRANVAGLGPASPHATIENRVRRADGRYRWTQWTNRALTDEDGRVLEFQAAGRDITERKEAEEAAGRLAAIVESAEDAIVSKTLDGVITSWNHAAETIFGYTAAEAVGRPIAIIIPPDRREEEDGILRRLRTGETIRHFETERITKDGRRLPVSLTVSPIRNAAGKIIGASKIGRDVSERHRTRMRLEELLRRERSAREEADAARREAERTNRAKDEFMAMLAHELRNPLSVVANAVTILESGAGAAHDSRARRMIRKQTVHLTRLLDDLLDVARITSGRIELEEETLDLRSVIETSVESQRHHVDGKRQRLDVSLPGRPVPVVGDPVRLQQVVGNLLNNASRYTPAGGSIGVTLAVESGEAVLRVRDDGRGIAPEDLGSIFELFKQANPTLARTEGGLGIGLTLVQRVVRLHGGRVDARSEGLGRGAELVVTLPLAAGIPEADARRETPPPPPGRRILVIEDHEDGREMLVETLRLHGHEVVAAATGQEGIEAAGRHAPEVVLVDIGLPDVDGYEVGRRIRKSLGAGVRLIAVTGYGQPRDRSRSDEAGFDAHLVKPVAPATLAEALRAPSGNDA